MRLRLSTKDITIYDLERELAISLNNFGIEIEDFMKTETGQSGRVSYYVLDKYMTIYLYKNRDVNSFTIEAREDGMLVAQVDIDTDARFANEEDWNKLIGLFPFISTEDMRTIKLNLLT
jgi:hypothetical protein